MVQVQKKVFFVCLPSLRGGCSWLLLESAGISWSPGIRWSRWPVPGWPDVVPALPALLVLRSPRSLRKFC